MKGAWRVWGLLALASAATVVFFLQRPGLGDDFTYWRFAFGLSEGQEISWENKGFHSLRWPVWGWCYLAIGAIGPGLASYYAAPFVYAALGAALAFALASRLAGSRTAGGVAALVFLFHPLLSQVIYRPMPEVPEALFGGVAVAAWYAMMTAPAPGKKALWALLSGLAIAVGHANRFTGLLIVPVLGLLTLGFFRRRWFWLGAVLLFAGLFFLAECAIYREVTGDFWHSIHQNLGARGRKGTEEVPLWMLPFRFLDTLADGGVTGIVALLFALGGGWLAWRRHGTAGRVVVAWAIWLFLGYSCALQGFDPPRPMIRDGPRFLGSLALPLSLLAAIGLRGLWDLWGKWRAPLAAGARGWLGGHRLAAGVAAWAALAAVSERDRFDMDYVPEFSAYLAGLPAGARVLTHDTIRELAHLVNGAAARRCAWEGRFDILEELPAMEAAAARSDHFLYSRRLLLLRERKAIQYKGDVTPPDLPSFLSAPERDWRLADVIKIDARPDLVIYRKRVPDDPEPLRIGPSGGDFLGIPLALPLVWDGGGEREFSARIDVPPALRGARVRLDLFASSDQVEAVVGSVVFRGKNGEAEEVEAKTHLHPVPASDFLSMVVPGWAERAELELKIRKDAEWIRVEKLWITADPPPEEKGTAP